MLAVEFKINLLAPARADSFLACGRVLRAGRTLTVCQAEVFTAGPGDRTLVAVMLSTHRGHRLRRRSGPVKTVADPRVVDGLVRRLEGSRPPRRGAGERCPRTRCSATWPTRAPACSPGPRGVAPARRVRKLLALYTAIPWPHGLPTPPNVDQRIGGTPPAVFALDRERAIAGLRALGSAPPNAFPTTHGHFGAMVPRDWQRWGFRHTDHHLRQFGL